jgi:orotate phosphoribosyltransferase
MNKKEEIIEIFELTGALLNGHFVLTSGRHSPTYFQCAKVLQYPEYLNLFSIMISDKFRSMKPDVVISPAIGGIVLGTSVGTELYVRTIFAERKKEKMVVRRGFEIKPNEKVLIVEDVITTGGSVSEVMDLVEKTGGNLIGVSVLVDRSNGTVHLHNNQFSIVRMDATSFPENEIPQELADLPVQKPGSRSI